MSDPIPGAGVCVVPGCEHQAQRNQLMCRTCWFRVTKPTRVMVGRAWRAWQRGSGTLGELRAAQQQAIREAE